MSDTTQEALPEVAVSAQAPDTNTGRRDHDAAYETQAPARPPAPPAPPPRQPSYPDDTVVLVVAGQRFTGWQEIQVTRGMELMPSTFVLRLTERFPESGTRVSILPGQTCQVLMGVDLVLTGFIDSYSSVASAKSHVVTVSGRSKTEDLVDCQAGMKQGQEGKATLTFSAATLLALATDLCAPFGISVTEPDGEGTPLVSIMDGIPQFTIPLGQSVYETLEPLARYMRRSLMDGPDGNLILATVGKEKCASGFTLPGTAIRAQVTFTKQDRFTIYLPAQSNFDGAGDVSAALHMASGNFFTPILDPGAFKGQPRHDGKERYRPRAIVSEQALDEIRLAEERAKWQRSRDYGRSQAVSVEVALWRDQAGKLWRPNTLAPVHMPTLKLDNLTWLISEVTYLRGAGGTRALIVLMPPEAFMLTPDLYTPFDPRIAQALARGACGPAVAWRGTTTMPRGYSRRLATTASRCPTGCGCPRGCWPPMPRQRCPIPPGADASWFPGQRNRT